ncbi:MAG: nickel pincer cofactor biosynthesis protein LarB [Coriobacteriales bacterium]|nr:nickel pincer cofactor biosynthesis protein LarB [Coriobacteriales bacterium]
MQLNNSDSLDSKQLNNSDSLDSEQLNNFASFLQDSEQLNNSATLDSEQLNNFATLDFARDERCGFPEVVFGEGKTPSQVCDIVQALLSAHDVAVVTRASSEHASMLASVVPDSFYISSCRFLYVDRRPMPLRVVGNTASKALQFKPNEDIANAIRIAPLSQPNEDATSAPPQDPESPRAPKTPEALQFKPNEDIANPIRITQQFKPNECSNISTNKVLVCCAGTSDLPVAEEAALTARIMGSQTSLLADVGVAGVHRLLARIDELRSARVIVAVAGMEGALPSLVAGLVDVPVIAVPTSVGYGANLGGISALLAMLNSCAGGVSVVNINNGFGAGVIAHRINIPPLRFTQG